MNSKKEWDFKPMSWSEVNWFVVAVAVLEFAGGVWYFSHSSPRLGIVWTGYGVVTSVLATLKGQ